MDVKKCDRCGCIIENEDPNLCFTGDFLSKRLVQIRYMSGHLCEDCVQHALKKFMDGEDAIMTGEILFVCSAGDRIKNGIDPDEYQSLAMRTCSICDSDRDKLLHGALGLASEAGEVAGIFQKIFQGHPNPAEDEDAKSHLVKECGDCLWMIAEILDAIHVPMSECMAGNIQKLRARYPEGFEPDKSLHRKAGDV